MSASDKRKRRLRLCFVGWGAIASRVGELLAERQPAGVEIVAVAVRDPELERPGLPASARLISGPHELAGLDIDMVIEVAGRPAVAIWGEAALRHAASFVVSSASAFTDEALLGLLLAVAEEMGSRVVVPSGALGDLGALAAAAVLPVDEVRHTIVKPPLAWKGTRAAEMIDLDRLARRTEFFAGTARQAAEAFPQNANVAVISALSGIGLDRTRVVLAADPSASRNIHEISAAGAFGTLELRLENEALKTNPKSSEMTALSLVRLIENAVAPLVR
ncbi:aspartate dehydrogenase [Aminobacter aminovorans]|uniref:L-aspartate dehydrogenase n=1 Tax=Aminobacter aminovorans TaxID=83263 RepID=A0A380WN08_AMIAI|nr:aspartate dehydrogenase [Aminobacter aminovorans]TCS25942.1 aspartate dehydrogenase [Aminobacter aminovorans]SUU90393.1 L-aspartate dehydrogenase [Aminobacter aminovorans]